MATTYCDSDDIVAIIGEAAVLACIDDDNDGLESATETLHVTNAIERAAVEMNQSLRHQYVLSELTSNDWCKWCNAYLASWFLYARRTNPCPNSLQEAVQKYRDELLEMRWGRQQLPEQAPSFEHHPTVTNFRPELGKREMPIRVNTTESTGASPEGNRKRFTSYQAGDL